MKTCWDYFDEFESTSDFESVKIWDFLGNIREKKCHEFEMQGLGNQTQQSICE